MVFYLKYRPQRIKDLDSLSVQEKLRTILGGKLPLASKGEKGAKISTPHAFLFTGPKGLGKTSTARILAKAINCTGRKSENDIEPCNHCASCISINEGRNLDVLEIDAASNRGIDEIRDLREKIRLSPVSSFKKVYIIDEVHMLTTEAFNALLKTLEEPPKHAVFILCTTEPHKVPQTISSRCFQVVFEKAGKEDLLRSFERIIKGEKIQIDREALELIASLSDGSFRDGAKILEEIALTGKGKIGKETVEKRFNVSNLSTISDNFLEALSNGNKKEAIGILDKLSKQGADFKFFLETIIENIHQDLLSKIDRNEDPGNLPETLRLLTKAHMEMKNSILPQIPLELAVLDFKNGSSEEISKTEEITEKSEVKIVPLDKNYKILSEIIEKVKLQNFSIAGVLRGCKIVDLGNGKLVISTSYKFHKDRLSDKKVESLIESAATDVIGKKVSISVILE